MIRIISLGGNDVGIIGSKRTSHSLSICLLTVRNEQYIVTNLGASPYDEVNALLEGGRPWIKNTPYIHTWI